MDLIERLSRSRPELRTHDLTAVEMTSAVMIRVFRAAMLAEGVSDELASRVCDRVVQP